MEYIEFYPPKKKFNISKHTKKFNKIGTIDLCPYCNKKLQEIPTRKKKCEHCNKFIFVKRRPIDDKHILLREEQLPKLELEWEKYFEIKDEERWSDYPDYEKVKNDLTKKMGFKPKTSDIVWGMLNSELLGAKSWQDKGSIYRSMASFLYGEDKDPYPQQKEAHKCRLLTFKESGLNIKAKIYAYSHDCCNECLKLNGKIYDLDEALRTMPIPCKKCINRKNKNGFSSCRCIWHTNI